MTATPVSQQIASRTHFGLQLLAILIAISLWPLTLAELRGGEPSNENRYVRFETGNRLALVVGNSDYEEHTPLSGVRHDVIQVENTLQDLDFVVSSFENIPTSETFQIDTLREFRRGIYQDDLVVVYLSGHGFSWAGFNYFATTQLPTTLDADQIDKYAIPIISIATYLGEHDPGGLLIIVDACRNIGGFISTGQEELQNKGMVPPPQPRSPAGTDYSIAWAQERGFSAFIPVDQPSIYTKNLLNHITTSDKLLDSLHRDVKVAVEIETDNQQSPGLTSWSNSDIYLKTSPEFMAQQKESWEAQLDTQDPEVIRIWALRNGLSPYVKSARRWLEDFEQSFDRLTSFTRVMPSEVSKAWTNAQRAERTIHVPTLSSTLPLAARRFALFSPERETSKQQTWNLADFEDLLLTAQGGNLTTHELEKSIGKAVALASIDNAIVTDNRLLFQQPMDGTALNPEFRIGDSVKVTGIEPQLNSQNVWVEIRNQNDQLAYLRISGSSEASAPVLLGRQIAVFDLPPNKNGLEALVDSRILALEISRLSEAGLQVTRIAIGGNYSPGDSDRDIALKFERSVHARYVLAEAGIDTKRITISPNSVENSNDLTTVKVFGY